MQPMVTLQELIRMATSATQAPSTTKGSAALSIDLCSVVRGVALACGPARRVASVP